MNPGTLNQILTVYRRESQKDELGQVSDAWVKQPGLIWARMMKAGGGSKEQADRETPSTSITFRARVQSAASSILPGDRISWRGDQYILLAEYPVGDGKEFIDLNVEKHADRTA